MDKTRLDGQVAIVTGGGGGIGRAIALALGERGADVAVAEIIPERAEEVCTRLTEMGRTALPLIVDMMDMAAIRTMVAAVDEHFGRTDILVNNAGGVRSRPFLQQNERNWERAIALNLVSMLTATQAAVPVMIRGGRGGAILNVSSIEGGRAAPNFSVYGACKAGMNSFTRTMALELAEHRIRVNAIAPDHTVTPGIRGNVTGPVDEASWFKPSPEAQDAIDRGIPLGRTGLAEECGDAAVFLCSRMSDYVTGTIMPVDGGTWASSGWVRSPDGRWVLNQGIPPLV
jgi:NAD(P)-dependent dehydrogenase (short-subunit alcohol dehydrogenase family)